MKEKCKKEQEEFEQSGKKGEYAASVSVEWLRSCIYQTDTDTFELGGFIESNGIDGVYWVWNQEEQDFDEKYEKYEEDEDEDDDSVSEDDEYDPQIHLNWLKENLEEAKEKKDKLWEDHLMPKIKELEKQLKEGEV